MSNIVAGDIFQKIIEDVSAASQNDFEENGVQPQTLKELQQVWQHKLSQLDVAHMPWDPKPQPQPQAATPQVAPPQPPPQQQQQQSQQQPQQPQHHHQHQQQHQPQQQQAQQHQQQHPQQQQQQQQHPQHQQHQQHQQQQQQQPQSASISSGNTSIQSHSPANGQQGSNGAAPRIKAEPGTEAAYQNVPQTHQQYGVQGNNQILAQQRAAHLLQAQFGSQANASLGAMQQRGIALPGQARAQGLQLPGQTPQGAQQQYAQHMRQQQHAQHQPRVKVEGTEENGQYPQGQNGQQSGVNYSQTDGSGDAMDQWQALMAQRRLLTSQEVAKNDRRMRDDVAQLVRSLDHGLMTPLGAEKRAKKNRRGSSQKVVTSENKGPAKVLGIPQLDGDADVKDEDDEDAINSDLDSSDDEANKEEEDEDEIDSMLCTYDKVQRVKNKWKCVLKDGVLKANGKEYLFHKATGEFEW